MIDANMTQTQFSTLLAEQADQALATPAPDADLREVAEKFEAIFLNEFLKQARKTKLADDLFASSAKTTYEEMLDREYSTSLSGNLDLGIADALVRQFGSKTMTKAG